MHSAGTPFTAWGAHRSAGCATGPLLHRALQQPYRQLTYVESGLGPDSRFERKAGCGMEAGAAWRCGSVRCLRDGFPGPRYVDGVGCEVARRTPAANVPPVTRLPRAAAEKYVKLTPVCAITRVNYVGSGSRLFAVHPQSFMLLLAIDPVSRSNLLLPCVLPV